MTKNNERFSIRLFTRRPRISKIINLIIYILDYKVLLKLQFTINVMTCNN